MIEQKTKRTARHEEEAKKRSEGQKIEDLDVRHEDVEDVKGGGTGNGGSVDPDDSFRS